MTVEYRIELFSKRNQYNFVMYPMCRCRLGSLAGVNIIKIKLNISGLIDDIMRTD